VTKAPGYTSPDVRSDIDVARAIAPALARALREIGKEEAAEIQSELSVPVGRGAAGNVVQRSAPGERPRMEHGILRANVGYAVDAGGRLPELTVFASRPAEDAGDDPDAAVILETELNRPFMGPAARRLEGYAAEKLARHMAGGGR
jgi:hypothetical protein